MSTFKKVLEILLESSKARVLRVGIKLNDNIIKGSLYQNHYDLAQENNIRSDDKYEYGFITPEGKFLNRKESLEWVIKNTSDIYNEYLKVQKKARPQDPEFGYRKELESIAYLKALGIHESLINLDKKE